VRSVAVVFCVAVNESVTVLLLPAVGDTVSQLASSVSVHAVFVLISEVAEAVPAKALSIVMDAVPTVMVGAGCVTYIYLLSVPPSVTVKVAVRAAAVGFWALVVNETVAVAAAVPEVWLMVSHVSLEEAVHTVLVEIFEVPDTVPERASPNELYCMPMYKTGLSCLTVMVWLNLPPSVRIT